MKKILTKTFLIVLALLVIMISLGGCNKAEDKISEEITEGIAEKYLEGITGGNADLDIEEGKWPQDMPNNVPEFKKGKIDSSSSITVSGQTQLTLLIASVKENDYNDYIGKLEEAGFIKLITSNYDGAVTSTYKAGNINLSLNYNSRTGDLKIGFIGSE